MTLAMQTRMKVFWRPSAIKVDPLLDVVPGAETLTHTRKEDRIRLRIHALSFFVRRHDLHGKALDYFRARAGFAKRQAQLPLAVPEWARRQR
jgi:hypothetical protein